MTKASGTRTAINSPLTTPTKWVRRQAILACHRKGWKPRRRALLAGMTIKAVGRPWCALVFQSMLGSDLMLLGKSPKRIIHGLSTRKQPVQLGLYEDDVRPFAIPSRIFSAFAEPDQISRADRLPWDPRVALGIYRLGDARGIRFLRNRLRHSLARDH